MSISKREAMSLKEIFILLHDGETKRGIELLYNEHYNKIYGIAFSIVKDPSVSEDIVQNVILRLMATDRANFPLKNQASWLYTVVKNETLMYLRKEKNKLSAEELSLSFKERSIDDFVDMDEYYSMLKGLSEEQKQVVTLKVLGGYTHKEIAKMLNKPTGTIQWIYNTSIKKLKYLLLGTLSLILVFGTLLGCRVADYVNSLSAYPESPGQAQPYVPVDGLIIILAVLVVFLIIAFIFICTKSYLIPTKASRKSI